MCKRDPTSSMYKCTEDDVKIYMPKKWGIGFFTNISEYFSAQPERLRHHTVHSWPVPPRFPPAHAVRPIWILC